MCNKAISFAKRNIGNIAFIILSIIIYLIFLDDNNYKLIFNIGQSKMVAIVVAIFTLLTYINDFIINKTIDSNDKSNFYLGYNIKFYSLYQKAGFKIYASQNLGFFLILMVLIQAALIFTKFNYSLEILMSLSNFILRYSKVLLAAWCSLLLVTIQYILLILYTIINYSKERFYNLYNLDLDYYDNINVEGKIEVKLSHQYKNLIFNLFKDAILLKYNNLSSKSSQLTGYILSKGKSVSNNDEELYNYLLHAYLNEEETIIEFIEKNKVKFYKIKEVSCYYLAKWNNSLWDSIVCSSPSFVLLHAIENLEVVDDIHKICIDNNFPENKLYNKGKIEYIDKTFDTTNELVTEIVNLIGVCFTTKKFIDGFSNSIELIKFFDILFQLEKSAFINAEDLEIYTDYLLYNLYYMNENWDDKTKKYIKTFECDVKDSSKDMLENKVNKYKDRFNFEA